MSTQEGSNDLDLSWTWTSPGPGPVLDLACPSTSTSASAWVARLDPDLDLSSASTFPGSCMHASVLLRLRVAGGDEALGGRQVRFGERRAIGALGQVDRPGVVV